MRSVLRSASMPTSSRALTSPQLSPRGSEASEEAKSVSSWGQISGNSADRNSPRSTASRLAAQRDKRKLKNSKSCVSFADLGGVEERQDPGAARRSVRTLWDLETLENRPLLRVDDEDWGPPAPHWHSSEDEEALMDDRRSRSRSCCMEFWAKMIIVPETHRSGGVTWLDMWVMFMTGLNIVVAFITPFQVALQPKLTLGFSALFIDLIFTLDMVSHFFLAFLKGDMDRSMSADSWVRDPARIAMHYCAIPLSDHGTAGWFWVDIWSVLPGVLEVLKIGAAEDVKFLMMFRMLRLIRLVRLGGRLEWLAEKAHAVYGFPFSLSDSTKSIVIAILACHWMACVWCSIEGRVTTNPGPLNSLAGPDSNSWLSVLIEQKGDSCTPSAAEDANCVYKIALYWATMTITGVGYGDVLPQNQPEYVAATLCMLIAGFIWAYIVGCIVTVLSSLDPHGIRFKQNMDDLNNISTSRGLPQDLRAKLRSFMIGAKHVARASTEFHLLEHNISQGLQREVAEQNPATKIFIRHVFWAKDLEQDALLQIVSSLRPCFYGRSEVIFLRQTMMIMHKGLAVVRGHFLGHGEVYGHGALLLVTEDLFEHAMPRTLSYVDILTLHRDSLVEVCRCYPQVDQRIRRAQIRTAVWRAFVKMAATVNMRREMRQRQSMAGDLLSSPEEGGQVEGKASRRFTFVQHNENCASFFTESQQLPKAAQRGTFWNTTAASQLRGDKKQYSDLQDEITEQREDLRVIRTQLGLNQEYVQDQLEGIADTLREVQGHLGWDQMRSSAVKTTGSKVSRDSLQSSRAPTILAQRRAKHGSMATSSTDTGES